MELILRICTWRNLALAATVVVAIRIAGLFEGYPRRWYRQWRYPPQGAAASANNEIMMLKEKREADLIDRRHQKVLALLSQAEVDGFDILDLRSQADAALQFNNARYRHRAALMLAEIELMMPHKKLKYTPLYPTNDDDEDIPADVRGRGVGPSQVVKRHR